MKIDEVRRRTESHSFDEKMFRLPNLAALTLALLDEHEETGELVVFREIDYPDLTDKWATVERLMEDL